MDAYIEKENGLFYIYHFKDGCPRWLNKNGKWETHEEIENYPEYPYQVLKTYAELKESPWYWGTEGEARACLIESLTPEELAEYMANKMTA